MGAWEDVELPIEDGLEAEVAHLTRVDADVLVALLLLLLAEDLGLAGVNLKVLLQVADALVVVVQALRQVILHVLNFFLGWE